jgi:hypothetical protein
VLRKIATATMGLPNRSGSHDERTKPALEHPVVSQDGQQGAKRGCGQADRNRHERTDEAGCG